MDHVRFSHGELSVFGRVIEDLLAAFRLANPEAHVEVTQRTDAESLVALRANQVDVAVVGLTFWPVEGFEVRRIVDVTCTGVLVAATHPLAAQRSIRLRDLAPLTWIHTREDKWPGYFEALQDALRRRGFDPANRRARTLHTLSNVEVANGEVWSLANEEFAARYLESPSAVVYRPMADPPIPAWLAMVWRPDNAGGRRLAEVAPSLEPPVSGRLRRVAG
jgi:DNA-binding transcriptional LysR family regulator